MEVTASVEIHPGDSFEEFAGQVARLADLLDMETATVHVAAIPGTGTCPKESWGAALGTVTVTGTSKGR